MMPSVPDNVCRNVAQVSHQYLSFTQTYCFGDRHASIRDRAFHLVVLATLTYIRYQKRATLADLALRRYPIQARHGYHLAKPALGVALFIATPLDVDSYSCTSSQHVKS